MIRKFRLWLIENFGFSQRESNGFLVMLVFLLITISFRVYVSFIPDQVNISQDSTKMDSLVALYESFEKKQEYKPVETQPVSKENPAKASRVVPASILSDSLIDINMATAEMLQKVYGVGPVLSERICKFRELLGGFYSMKQLNDVYGLEDDVIDNINQKFEIKEPYEIRTIPINQATFKEVLRHPYINYEQTKKIFNTRKDTVLQSFLILVEDSVFTVSDTVRLYSYITF